MPPEVTVLVGVGGVLATILTAVLTYRAATRKTSTDSKTALDAYIDTRMRSELERVYARIDELETEAKTEREAAAREREAEGRRTAAMTRILRAIARQWSRPEGPDLDPSDIAAIEDTIPPQWIRRPTA